MNEVFTIGEFCFRLLCPEEIVPPPNFMRFCGGGTPAFTYRIVLTEDLPEPEGEILARRPDLLVSQTPWGECRHIGVRGQDAFYACYEETGPDEARILVHSSRLRTLNLDPAFASLLALERRLIQRDALILHCAFVEYEGMGLLFSAPSETGKTTQANLWNQYRGAETVNGDRALLQMIHGRWQARGWPICGSSQVCQNRDLPIRAIVMLSQAKEDAARRLSPAQALARIYSQVTVNRWNQGAVLHAMELLEGLCTSLPVYHLACTMEESAVQALERAICE